MLGKAIFVLLLHSCVSEVICEGSIKAGKQFKYEECKVQLIRKKTGGVIEDESVSPSGYFVVPFEGRIEDYYLKVLTPGNWILDRSTAEAADCLNGDVDFIRTGLTIVGEVRNACEYPLPNNLFLKLSPQKQHTAVSHDLIAVDETYRYRLPTDITPGLYKISIHNPHQYESLEFAGINFSVPEAEGLSGPSVISVLVNGKTETLESTTTQLLKDDEVLQEQLTINASAEFKFQCDGAHHIKKLSVASSTTNATFSSPISVLSWINGERLRITKLQQLIKIHGPVNSKASLTIAAGHQVDQFDGTFNSSGIFTQSVWLFVDADYTITTTSSTKEVIYEAIQYPLRRKLLYSRNIIYIYPIMVRICAQIQLHHSRGNSILVDRDGEVTLWEDQIKTRQLQLEEEGMFCVMAPRSSSERVFKVTAVFGNFSLSPSQAVVPQNLIQPPAPLVFTESVFDVLCTVKCLDENCRQSLEEVAKTLRVFLGTNGEELTSHLSISITANLGGSVLTIKDVPPGNYTLLSPDSPFCWRDTYFVVENQLVFITLKQSGYVGFLIQRFGFPLNVTISQSVSDSSTKSFELTSNEVKEVCLTRTGTYLVSTTNSELSCFRFEDLMWDSKRTQHEITAALVVINGQIESFGDAKPILEVDGDVREAKLIVTDRSYELRALPGMRVRVKVKNGNEGAIYFPQLQEVELPRLGVGRCDLKLQSLRLQEAEVLKGRIIPPVEGVSVSLKYHNTSEGFTEYYNQTTVLSTAVGLFTLGPLPSDVGPLTISVHKVGFAFTPSEISLQVPGGNELHFKAVAVCSLSIKLSDNLSTPIESLLVSVSSESGTEYKKSLRTLENGFVTFSDLEPGKYFVKYNTKAYKLPSESLTVRFGTEELFERRADRSGFTISGRIQYLNSSGASDVTIEIYSENEEGYVRERVSSEDGLFNVVGLQSGRYNISVRLERGFNPFESSSVGYAFPQSQPVQIADSDISISPITVLLMPNTIDVVGNVVVSDTEDSLEDAFVTLSTGSGTVIRRQSLPHTKVFQFSSVRIPAQSSEGDYFIVTVC